MRQGHQNRRGRGRGSSNNNNSNNSSNNNNNRKGQNPLTRTFESNGPDVKIRGTPAHIAEKYISLARDAKSSGDEVLAENYLQHAEHYNRIILAFRDQQISQGGDPAAGGMSQRFRVPQLNDGPDDEIGEDGDDYGGGEQPGVVRGNEPQPGLQQPQPFEGGERPERPEREQRFDRNEGRDYNRPHDRSQDRPQEGRDRQDRQGGNRYDDRQRRHPDQFRNRDRGDGRPDYNRQGGQDRDRGYDRNQDRGPDRGPDRNMDRDRGNQDRGPDRGPDRAYDRNQDRGPDRTVDRPQHDRPPVDRPPMDRQPMDRQPPPLDRPMERVAEPAGFVPERLPVQPPVAVAAPVDPAFDAINGTVVGRPPRAEGAAPRRRERFQPQHEQPEFLRRPVRRPRRDAAPTEGGGEGDVTPVAEAPVAPVRNDGGSDE